jgi:hypothetical protein
MERSKPIRKPRAAQDISERAVRMERMGRKAWSDRGLIEETPRIRIMELKNAGMLEEGKRTGVLTFSGGSIGIEVCIDPLLSFYYIRFTYGINGKSFDYCAVIEPYPLTFGLRFYFICPDTGKRVSTLYWVNGYFSSRYFHQLVYRRSREHRRINEDLMRSIEYGRKALNLFQKRYCSPRAEKYWAKALKYGQGAGIIG